MKSAMSAGRCPCPLLVEWMVCGWNLCRIRHSPANRIQIKVSLPVPASAEERYLLRLQPGDGDNPAVEGEDFNGEPILVRLNKGEREPSSPPT